MRGTVVIGTEWRRWLLTAALVLAAVLWLLPLIVVLITSLKPAGDVVGSSPLSLAGGIDVSNYAQAWDQANYGEYLLNSVMVCLVKVPLGLLVSALTAYGFTRFRFRFRRTLLVLVIAGSMVPLQVALIPIFQILLDLNLISTYTGLILPYIAFGLPFQVIFLVSFFGRIPKELDEAARLDGVGPWRYFRSVVLPLSTPILASLFILDLVTTWNEFPIALTVLQNAQTWTVPMGLLSFQGSFSSEYTLMSAAVMMAALPVLIVYVLMQRFFVQGLVAGSIKE